MSIISLSKNICHKTTVPLLYPSLSTYRSASLTRAIGRGIRKSKNVGFRGKEKSRGETSYGGDSKGAGVVRRTADAPPIKNPSPMTNRGWAGPIKKAMDDNQSRYSNFQPAVAQSSGGRERRLPANSQEGPTRIRMGKRIIKEHQDKPRRIAPSVRSRDPDSSFGRRSQAAAGKASAWGNTSSREGMSSYSGRGESSSYSGRAGTGSYSGRGDTSSFSGRGGFSSFPDRGDKDTFSGRGGRDSLSGGGRQLTAEPQKRYEGRGGTNSFSDRGAPRFDGGPDLRHDRRGGVDSFSDKSKQRSGNDFEARGGKSSYTAGKPDSYSTPNSRDEPKRTSSYETRSQSRGPSRSELSTFEKNDASGREALFGKWESNGGDASSREPWSMAGKPKESPMLDTRTSYEPKSRSFDQADRYSAPKFDTSDSSDPQPRFSKSVDKNIPISVPYTTAGSEFLYGTSVVEAALRSTRVPRRKYYKLYIYSGEQRDNTAKDSSLERLARRRGIQVSKVSGDWLRAMDKMSNSRPHNGYILEASPLPRLPVTSLGELADHEGEPGFKVVLDRQTREEKEVNGITNFIQQSRYPLGRKPLVLFLDSILDPGNLGGIIRTACFLGVTAIGISKNCAAFSPVVLKASAGASEDVTIFTVNKPAGFIADSKAAGWKIFAAVAPSGIKPTPLATDDLINPLSGAPCILMLGGEGDGLRENLKSKADVNLTIRGSGNSLNVDSLNVSVATGILCNAFLRRSSARSRLLAEESHIREEEEENPDVKVSSIKTTKSTEEADLF